MVEASSVCFREVSYELGKEAERGMKQTGSTSSHEVHFVAYVAYVGLSDVFLLDISFCIVTISSPVYSRNFLLQKLVYIRDACPECKGRIMIQREPAAVSQ